MQHTVNEDFNTYVRLAVEEVFGVRPVPEVFECEQCQAVREAIAAWQDQAEGKCDRGECECGFHTYIIGSA